MVVISAIVLMMRCIVVILMVGVMMTNFMVVIMVRNVHIKVGIMYASTVMLVVMMHRLMMGIILRKMVS